MVADHRFTEMIRIITGISGEIHPKAGITADIIRNQLIDDPNSRIIVFASYRDTVSMLVDYLTEEGISACRFVGQASKQKEKRALTEETDRGDPEIPGRGVPCPRRHFSRRRGA
jgi:ERCC4-like helicases